MKLCHRSIVAPLLALAGTLPVPCGLSAAAPAAERPLYLDTAQTVEKRVGDLIGRLTVEEKTSQLMNAAPAIPRLGVPEHNWWNECLHGVARNGVATVFPQAIGMAATWNVDLIREEADVISTEARAKHHEAVGRGDREIYTGLTMWSPNINIFRDPRWGRGQETYGEDPYLTARLGVAFVKGLQGEDQRYLKVVSTPKHFAVHSGPEPLRHAFDAQASTRDLRQTYLPAFEAAVREAGAASVMCAYNRYLGQPACAHETLLGQILRKEWGFAGYVVSDCGAITDIWRGHGYRRTPAEAASSALRSGCDLECGDDYRSLGEAVRTGLVQESDLDIALARLFTARFRLGLFDPPESVPFAGIPITASDTPEHRALALRVAQQSIVLLKNARHTLPLSKGLKTVAVIGPNADSRSVLLGNYNGTPSRSVTALAGIRAKLPGARVLYARGAELFDVVATPIPSALLRPRFGGEGKTGLSAEYFDNPNLAGRPRVERVDEVVDFGWEGGAAAPGVPIRDFSVRWTGLLVPDKSGRRRIGTTSDDGVRLWIDGQLVVDDWTLHAKRIESREVDLVAGRPYQVKMEYYQWRGDAAASLVWVEAVDRERLAAEAVEVARAADAAILVLGISPELEGEEMEVVAEGFKGGDRTDIGLPAAQQKLLEAVHATGKPVVLVLMSGSALAVNWAAEHVPAIVEAWYGGEEAGTAIADVLFGDVNPAGRLPVTFYRSVDQLPPFEDYAMAGRTYRYFSGEPLFPFGHGLSYTRFRYGGLKLTCACGKEGGCAKRKCPVEAALRAKMISEHGGAAPVVGGLAKPQGAFGASEEIRVTVRVENVGQLPGDEVVQVYVRDIAASVPVPIRSLVGLKRVHLAAGEAQEVTLAVSPRQLSVITDDGRRVVEPGVFQICVGGKQPGFRGLADAETTDVLSAQFEIVGDVTPIER